MVSCDPRREPVVGLTLGQRVYLVGLHLDLAPAGVPGGPLVPNPSVELQLFWEMELLAGGWGPQLLGPTGEKGHLA